MKNKIIYSTLFEKRYKFFSKKFMSLKTELKELEKGLLKNSELGSPLGNGLFKIRLASKDKVSGKSGGFRSITYLVTQIKEINFIVIYDKSEDETIKKADLIKLVKSLYSK